MRAGVIDIGSNAIRLLIGEVDGENIKILQSLKNITPIGKSTFFKGSISQEAITQVISILEKYKKVLAEYDVAQVKGIATTAVREASNKEIFVDTISRKTGFSIEVLSVGDVIYYIDVYISHKLKDSYPIHNKNLIIAEVGAGSLDISVMRKGFTVLNLGMPLGTLRLKQLMGKLDGSFEETLEAVQEYIECEFSHFKKMSPRLQIDDIIFIDENLPYLQNFLQGKKETKDLFQLTKKDAAVILKSANELGPEGLTRQHKIPKEVADTFHTYLIVLNKFFDLIENDYIYLLEASLAGAILTNSLFNLELSEKYNKKNQLISVAKFICQKFDADLEHVQHVAFLSDILFNHLKAHLGLQEEESLYLTLAAYLHDIGVFIHNSAHHKHSEYIIKALNLFRLSEDESKMIACIARYHRRAHPQKTHFLYAELSTQQQILVQKLSAILRLANSLDRSHKQKIKNIEIKLGAHQEITLILETKQDILLEKTDFMQKKSLLEEITGNEINILIKS